MKNHVLITGASSGIGLELARLFIGLDWKTSLVARRTPQIMEGVSGEPKYKPGNCAFIQADLIDPGQRREALVQAAQRLGPVDILINNAGRQSVGPVLESDAEERRRIFALNSEAPMDMTEIFLGELEMEHNPRQPKGVINISSLSGLLPVPLMAHYSASKAALGFYSEALRLEVKPDNIRILTVYPGPVATPLAERAFDSLEMESDNPLRKLIPEARPADLAREIWKAWQKNDARLVYPPVYQLAGTLPWLSQWVTELGFGLFNKRD